MVNPDYRSKMNTSQPVTTTQDYEKFSKNSKVRKFILGNVAGCRSGLPDKTTNPTKGAEWGWGCSGSGHNGQNILFISLSLK